MEQILLKPIFWIACVAVILVLLYIIKRGNWIRVQKRSKTELKVTTGDKQASDDESTASKTVKQGSIEILNEAKMKNVKIGSIQAGHDIKTSGENKS